MYSRRGAVKINAGVSFSYLLGVIFRLSSHFRAFQNLPEIIGTFRNEPFLWNFYQGQKQFCLYVVTVKEQRHFHYLILLFLNHSIPLWQSSVVIRGAVSFYVHRTFFCSCGPILSSQSELFCMFAIII